MTDQNESIQQELERLRLENQQLKAHLSKTASTDHRDLPLLKAGVRPDALADAKKLFRPSGSLTTGVWTLDGEATTDLDGMARRFFESRPWFLGASQPEPEKDGPDWPVDRNGNLIPITDLTDEQLYAVAGMPPKRDQQKETHTEAELDAMPEADRLAIQAGLEAKPDSEAKAKDQESLDQLNAEMDRRLESRREAAELQKQALPMLEVKKAWGR